MPAQPAPDRRRYAPLTPSPLNPNTYLDVTKIRQQQQRHQSTLRAKPPNANPSSLPQQYAALANASPTERLVRQKAAAAWRCETLRHYVLLKPQSGSGHARSNHHHLIDFAVNSPPTPTNGSHNHNHNQNHHNSHPNSGGNNNNNRPPPSPTTSQPNPRLSPSPPPTPPPPRHVWPPFPTLHNHNHNHHPPTPSAGHAFSSSDDVLGDIGLGINNLDGRGYRDLDLDPDNNNDGDGDGGSFPLTSPLLSPTALLLSGGPSSGGMVLPLHVHAGAVKQRAGRRRVGGGGGGIGKNGGGFGGGGVVGVRRVLVVVVLFLGVGLVHGLVSAFGSGGGGGGPPPAER